MPNENDCVPAHQQRERTRIQLHIRIYQLNKFKLTLKIKMNFYEKKTNREKNVLRCAQPQYFFLMRNIFCPEYTECVFHAQELLING